MGPFDFQIVLRLTFSPGLIFLMDPQQISHLLSKSGKRMGSTGNDFVCADCRQTDDIC